MNKGQHVSKDKDDRVVNKPNGRLRHQQGVFSADRDLSNEDVKVLLNELQVYQLELEMQNDELKASYLTIDRERTKFIGLFDLAPVGYFILDYLGMVEEANQNGVDQLELSKQTIIGKRFQSFIAQKTWEDFYNFLYRMQHLDGKQSVEVKLILPDDRLIYTIMEGIAIPSMIAEDIKYYITVIDITQSRNAQQVLKETKERLEMTLTASSTGTWTIIQHTSSVFLDTHSLKIMSVADWKFDGTIKGLINLIYPDDQLLVKQHLITTANGVKDIDLEFRVRDGQGKLKFISAKGHEIKIGDGNPCFAGILMDITERKRMEEEAEMLKNGQQKLVLSAALTAQEKERQKISRALHDSVCQLLYGIRLNLESIQRSQNLKMEFKNINELLNQAIKETRDLSYELTPSVLRDFGFVAGIREMAQRTSTPHFKIDASIDGAADKIAPEIQLYIFRMIQELISNSINHAKASHAEIKVRIYKKEVTIIVSDNGIGLLSGIEEAVKKGSGLRGIKNRVYLLNGKIKFNHTHKGLAVTIVFKTAPGTLDLS